MFMNQEQLHELLYQALETEKGGVEVYEAAVRCALNGDLKEEWQRYLDQTRTHMQILADVLSKLGLDPQIDAPGRKVVRHLGWSLVKAMEMGLRPVNPRQRSVPLRSVWYSPRPKIISIGN
jgi:hypothetical protein